MSRGLPRDPKATRHRKTSVSKSCSWNCKCSWSILTSSRGISEVSGLCDNTTCWFSELRVFFTCILWKVEQAQEEQDGLFPYLGSWLTDYCWKALVKRVLLNAGYCARVGEVKWSFDSRDVKVYFVFVNNVYLKVIQNQCTFCFISTFDSKVTSDNVLKLLHIDRKL